MTSQVQEGTILLGKYRVEKELGQGAMGYVVAARHEHLGELFAVKLMLPEALERPEAAARFLREARACARIKSEHVVRVTDSGEHEPGMPVMVMEYLVGE
ncbi:MAG TPA: protein kinase, partial [Polyangium sp.]|nr:protein kinase [Polyangium sp.]